MNQTSSIVIFFHGLNTFGDDILHLGPVSKGRMDRHMKEAFEKRGIRFYSMNGIGSGSPEHQARLCARQIETLDIEDGSTVHFLGNSLGGLVSRVLANFWSTGQAPNSKNLKVAKLISFGSPHRGARAAEFALRLVSENPRLTKMIAHVGYNIGANNETYRHYAPQSMDDFNRRYPLNAAAPEHAFLCAVPLRDVSPYFWGLYSYIHGLSPVDFAKDLLKSYDSFAPSDGLIMLGSQSWGEPHGPYALDHFAQSGFFSVLARPARREKARKEFEKLCDDMSTLIKTS